MQARREGGSVGSDEPPRLPNGPLEFLRKVSTILATFYSTNRCYSKY